MLAWRMGFGAEDKLNFVFLNGSQLITVKMRTSNIHMFFHSTEGKYFFNMLEESKCF